MKSLQRYAAVLLLSLAAQLGGCVTQLPADAVRLNAYDAYQAGDYTGARDQFTECVDRNGTDYKAHYYLGLIGLEAMDNPAYARRHLELAHTLRESKVRRPLVMKVGPPDTAVPPPSRKQVTDALAEAIYQMDANPQLFAFCRDAIDTYGEVDDYLRLARYLQRTGDHDAARNTYIKAIKIALPDDPSGELALAAFYDTIGDRQAALTQLRAAYGIDPEIEGLADKIRAHGMVPGPTIALPRQHTADNDAS